MTNKYHNTKGAKLLDMDQAIKKGLLKFTKFKTSKPKTKFNKGGKVK